MSLERLTVPQSMEVLKEDGETSQEETEATPGELSLAKLGIIWALG